jgi:hypothetical protein
VSEPLVVVGRGMAAVRLVDKLTAPLRLSVPGADLHANCSIPPISLSPVKAAVFRQDVPQAAAIPPFSVARPYLGPGRVG